MSVMLETSLGELVIDLEVDRCPKTCENFLKLCKIKYYALNAFFNVSKDFIAQTGDPTATGTGGESLDSYLHSLNPASSSKPARYFQPEITNKLKHTTKGTVSMAVAPTDPPGCGSQFFITLADSIEYLDGKHAVFGHVIEGLDTLDRINDAYLDKEGRPLQDIRIRHVEILEDPFDDPSNLIDVPPSPIRPPDALNSSIVRISDEEDPLQQIKEEEAEEKRRQTAAASSALTLEMIGDIPFAAVRPPENILFVCKLNPVTQDDDLDLIFSRFGKILSCEIVRDKKSGDSLQYAFIEFDERESAEQAYFKMQNVLVDDRRIWVDFSQSVAKMNISQVTSGGRGRGRGRGGGGGGGGRGAFGGGGGGGRGGYGGGEILQAASGRYSGHHTPSHQGDGYGMVFDGVASDKGRKKDRSRSPRRHRERSRSAERRREYREKDSHRDRERDRDRHRYDDRRDRDHRPRESDRDDRRYRDDRDRSSRR